MASPRYGFFYNASGNTSTNSSQNRGKSPNNPFLSARVKDIILDERHPKFYNYGEWNSIGAIFFESAKNPKFNSNSLTSIAYPLFPNIKHYPLINEIVTIVYLANSNLSDNASAVSAYYLPPTNIWNSNIHNAIPSTDILPKSQQKDYAQVEAGSVRRVTDESTEINLGATFKEENLFQNHPLLPFEGDIIYEGRFGNSIRFGSTIFNPNDPSYRTNPWSEFANSSNSGHPILILRNGQGENVLGVDGSYDSWVPSIEDINQDLSSIYLTSNQKINVFYSNNLSDSFNLLNLVYKNPSQSDIYQLTYNSGFTDPQIILNSNRLVFNAKTDPIILKSPQVIHLSSKFVNIDGETAVTISSPNITLGLPNPDSTLIQPPVLGDNLNDLLLEVSTFLKTLNIAFKGAIDSNGIPIAALNIIAGDAEILSNSIKNKVSNKSLLSNQVKIT